MQPELVTAAVADSDGNGGCNELPDRREGATAAAAGDVTGVHEAEAWVDPISQTEPSRGERSKVEHPGVAPRRYSRISVFPSILVPDSIPFGVWTV